MTDNRAIAVLGGGLLLLILAAMLRPAQPSSLDIGFHLNASSGANAPTVHGQVTRSASGLTAYFDNRQVQRRPHSACINQAAVAGAKIMAFGAYEGGAKTDLSFAGEGDPVGRVSLQARPNGPPLVVVFSAYEPIVWDFSDVPAHRIRAVLAYGYTPQAVANLPAAVPVRFISQADGKTPCGTSHFVHKETKELGALRTQVLLALGAPLDGFVGSYDARAVHLDGDSFAPISEPQLKPEQLRTGGPLQVGGLLAGDRGLMQLVAKGDLRRATASELAQFKAKAIRPFDYYLEETYFVARSTTLPDGMIGMNGRYFLIPKGMPIPQNPGIQNAFYHLENGSCTGFC